jgi:hypothetical protein
MVRRRPRHGRVESGLTAPCSLCDLSSAQGRSDKLHRSCVRVSHGRQIEPSEVACEKYGSDASLMRAMNVPADHPETQSRANDPLGQVRRAPEWLSQLRKTAVGLCAKRPDRIRREKTGHSCRARHRNQAETNIPILRTLSRVQGQMFRRTSEM